MPIAKKTPKKQSKSDFVRVQPATLSAADVLAKAKAAGLKITPQLVYKVRSVSKPQGKAKKAPARSRRLPRGAESLRAAKRSTVPCSQPC